MITKEEFYNIIMVAQHMAKIDGDFDPSEHKMLFQLIKSSGVPIAELKRNLESKKSLKEAIQDIQSDHSKKALINILLFLAHTDRNFDEEEKKFVTKVIRALNMDPKDFSFDNENTVQKNLRIIEEYVHNYLESIRQLIVANES